MKRCKKRCGVVWCRYSSYGRHFTKLHLLEQVAQLLSFYLHDGDTVVDFSCGANAFVPLVKQEGRKQGLSLKGKAYDIITSQNMEDFERTSWLDTCPGQQPNNFSSPGIARGCFGEPVLCWGSDRLCMDHTCCETASGNMCVM